jgi:hypothetical protein
MKLKRFTEYNTKNSITKNKRLLDRINGLSLSTISEKEIIDMVCEYGLCVEDRDGYGEWNKYMIKSRNEEGIFQTPKQISDALLELLKHNIKSYAEIGIFKGGSYLLISNILKLKNPNLESIGIDIQDRHLTEDIKKYINLHVGTSEDFKGKHFDFVFIDGDHSYEGVKTDYQNLGQYANIVMFHDINDSTCPGVVKFWNEVKEGKKYKEFTYQTNNNKIHGIGLLFLENSVYPKLRHFTSYESALSILNNGYVNSRKELKNNINNVDDYVVDLKKLKSNDSWWSERKQLEKNRFNSEDIIYCVPDWYNDSGYETGHGPVMIYFDPKVYEDFNVTLTIEDSLTEKRNRNYNKEEIKKIYSNILNNNQDSDYKSESNEILENLNSKNQKGYFNTSRGRLFIESRFYNRYCEIQLHSDKVPTSYIKEIRLTDNYLGEKELDNSLREELIMFCKNNNIKIIEN